MRKLVVATKNAGKVAEIAAALESMDVMVQSVAAFGEMAEPEETGVTFGENALLKARYYAEVTGLPCLADDSGLEVDLLQGAPGVYSARYAGVGATDRENNEKLLQALQAFPSAERTGRFRCALVFFDPGGATISANGTCEGIILASPQGDGGFGYDPLFFMPPFGKTLAEMTVAEKNSVSHRGQGLRIMTAKLKEYWSC